MKCDEILPLLEPFLDRECSEIESRLVTAHLEQCSHCCDSLSDLEAEIGFYLRIAERVELPPSLWENLLRSAPSLSLVEPGPNTGEVARSLAGWLRDWRLAPLPAFAMLVLAIGVTITVMKHATSIDPSKPRGPAGVIESIVPNPSQPPIGDNAREGPQDPGPVSTGGVTRSQGAMTQKKRESASDLVRDAEAKYLKAIAILERDASRHRAEMDPGMRAELEQTMVDVERAIASTRQAVRQSPSDPVTLQYMLTAYSRKVDLLRQMVGD